MEAGEAWVSISEASIRLGVPERTARRAAGKLADTDRQVADNGRQRVRLEALAVVLGVRQSTTVEGEPVRQTSESGRQKADSVSDNGRQEADTGAEPMRGAGRSEDWRARALVAEARAELLERELGDWKEQAREALHALQQAQDDARAARLMPTGRGPGLIASQETAGSPESSPSVPGGASAPPKRSLWPWKRKEGA